MLMTVFINAVTFYMLMTVFINTVTFDMLMTVFIDTVTFDMLITVFINTVTFHIQMLMTVLSMRRCLAVRQLTGRTSTKSAPSPEMLASGAGSLLGLF